MINFLNNLSEEILGEHVVAKVEEKVVFMYTRSYSQLLFIYHEIKIE